MRLGKKADTILSIVTPIALGVIAALLTAPAISRVFEAFNLNEIFAFIFVYGGVLFFIYVIIMWIYGFLRLITGRRGR